MTAPLPAGETIHDAEGGVGKPLKCPFCNGVCDPNGWRTLGPKVISGPECYECGATAPDIAAWNRRAPLDREAVARIICRQEHIRQFGTEVWREGELELKVDAYWHNWLPTADAILALNGGE